VLPDEVDMDLFEDLARTARIDIPVNDTHQSRRERPCIVNVYMKSNGLPGRDARPVGVSSDALSFHQS
jgi:hypothetical protein